MKPNDKCSYTVSPSVQRRERAITWPTVLSPFLRHLNMGTLALIMFVAFALLSTSHGKDAGNGGPAPVGIPKGEVIIDKSHDDVSKITSEPAGKTTSASLTVWQFMSMIVNAFAGAFNDPLLIEYGKQQGTDTSGSPTTLCQGPTHQSWTSSGPLSTYYARVRHVGASENNSVSLARDFSVS